MINKFIYIISVELILLSIFGYNLQSVSANQSTMATTVEEKQIVNIVNVQKFGAKGDGVSDDYTPILNAINYVRKTSDVLFFPNGDYYCSKRIIINDSCSIRGESPEYTTITFRDKTQYADCDEWNQRGLFTFTGSSLSLSNITIRYIGDTDTDFKRTKMQNGSQAEEGVLFSVLHSDAITVDNCNFWVGGRINPSITCMWMKAENADISNVIIQNSKFVNDTIATVGGCLWMSAHDNEKVKLQNINVNNCTFLKHANDEALAIWGYNVSDVTVKNNNITYTGQQVQNDVLVSFGMPNPRRTETLRNIVFTDNKINIIGKCVAAVKFQLLSDDSYIKFCNNTITGEINKNTTFDCVWFYKSGTVDFSDNDISITGGKKVGYIKKKHENEVKMKGNSFSRKKKTIE